MLTPTPSFMPRRDSPLVKFAMAALQEPPIRKSWLGVRAAPPPPVIAKTSAPVAVTKIATTTQPELQRPPVPLRHAPRPPVPIKEDIVGKPGDDKIDKHVDTAATTAPTPEDDEGARLAKSAIERDGYKSVKVVSKSADGSWRGRARRGQTEVGVTVDAAGNVHVD